MKNLSKEIINQELQDFFDNNKNKILKFLSYKRPKNIKINNKIYNQMVFVQDYYLQYLYFKVYNDLDVGIKVYEIKDDIEDEDIGEEYKIYGIKYKEMSLHEYII